MKPIPVWKYAMLGLFGFFFGMATPALIFGVFGIGDGQVLLLSELFCGVLGARWLIKREQRLRTATGG